MTPAHINMIVRDFGSSFKLEAMAAAKHPDKYKREVSIVKSDTFV